MREIGDWNVFATILVTFFLLLPVGDEQEQISGDEFVCSEHLFFFCNECLDPADCCLQLYFIIKQKCNFITKNVVCFRTRCQTTYFSTGLFTLCHYEVLYSTFAKLLKNATLLIIMIVVTNLKTSKLKPVFVFDSLTQHFVAPIPKSASRKTCVLLVSLTFTMFYD